jgi:hypothetical protein
VFLNPGRQPRRAAAGHLIAEDYVNPFSLFSSRLTLLALLCVLIFGASAGSAAAQSKPVVNAGVDFPTVYFFRGIRQEADPKFTTFVFGDVGFPVLTDGSGGLTSATINVGSWNAFLTGSSGSENVVDDPFYESDFYASVTLGMSNGISITPMFTAYTSPNDVFTTVKEFSFKVAHASKYAPYALLAFEFGGDDSGQADGGQFLGDGGKGTYLELGIGPSWPIADGKATVGVPIKLGFSLKDYYQHPVTGEDSKFGYIDGGVLITVPFAQKFNVHGGVNFLGLGDTNAFFNGDSDGDRSGWVIASVGLGVTF